MTTTTVATLPVRATAVTATGDRPAAIPAGITRTISSTGVAAATKTSR
jgi:hypothetical protein